MKKILLIIGIIIAAALITLFFIVTDGLSEGKNLPINGIKLENVPDGSYTGDYDFKRWSNTVIVSVSNHKITSIGITKDMPLSEITKASDELFRRVISAQNTTVDVVSGATVTSKAYLKAIENAFAK